MLKSASIASDVRDANDALNEVTVMRFEAGDDLIKRLVVAADDISEDDGKCIPYTDIEAEVGVRDAEYFGFGIDHVDIIGIDPFYDITDLADEVFGLQHYVNIVQEPRREHRTA